ncbi:MAG TPA: hypothetical protein G4O08_13190 [Anaerolineae bacterium]|nr:hypothetical protein [Anaerolineae bacterium]
MAQQGTPQGPVFGPTQQTTVIGYERKEKPGVLAIIFGIFTILVSIGIGIFSLLGGLGMLGLGDEGGMIGLAFSCVPLLFALYGLFSGAMLCFVGGAAGKVFAIIFWVLLIISVICIAGFGALFFGLLGMEGY